MFTLRYLFVPLTVLNPDMEQFLEANSEFRNASGNHCEQMKIAALLFFFIIQKPQTKTFLVYFRGNKQKPDAIAHTAWDKPSDWCGIIKTHSFSFSDSFLPALNSDWRWQDMKHCFLNESQDFSHLYSSAGHSPTSLWVASKRLEGFFFVPFVLLLFFRGQNQL